jgi:hypothetical protein
MVFDYLYRWYFSHLNFDNYTLDFDSTVMTRYGEQQGSQKGHNPQKRGRKSHHPLMAFIPDSRMIANFWLRPGDSHTANNFLGFLADTLSKLSGKSVKLIRGDSGFYSDPIMQYLESHAEQPYHYVIAAKFYSSLKYTVIRQRTWLKLDEGLELAETLYQAETWEAPRRIIMVRQEIEKRPKAAGKQLRLFSDEAFYQKYRYRCFVTNLDLSAKMVYDIYRNRADAENRIKELKYDFGAGRFNTHNFWATEATLNFVMLAYNLISLFRQALLGESSQPFLKTIRYKAFAIGGYLI